MIKNNQNQNFKPYLGNYKPLNIYKGNTKIAGYTNQETTGSSIHLENCYNQEFNGEIYGNSSQATRSGKNLANLEDIQVGKTLTGSGTIGSNYSLSNNATRATIIIPCKELTNYTISIKEGYALHRIGLFPDSSLNNILQDIAIYFRPGVYTTETFTTPAGTGVVVLSFKMVGDATTMTTELCNESELQLEEGSTATEYEQYGAMPSPEFPSEIENVSSIPIVKRNKNLMYTNWYQDFIGRINNLSYASAETFDGRNCLKYDRRCGYGDYDNKYFFTTNWKENTQYVIHFDVYTADCINGYANLAVQYTDGTSMELSGIQNEQWKHYEIVTYANKTVKYIRNSWRENYSYIDLDTCMIEEGTTATDYIKYKPQLNLTLNTQQPMCSIGDVKDCFIRVDGVWKERHIFGTVTLNGTENWEAQWTGIRYGYRTNIENMKLITSTTILSNILTNYFKNYNQEDLYALQTGSNGICQRANQKQVIVRYDSKTTINDFKNWLTTNITTVMYELETPTDLICNAEQVAVLEQLAYYPQDCILEFEGTEAKVIYAEMDI